MESEENIITQNFNKYKDRIFSFLYFFQFLFTMFSCILIVFQQYKESSINFIYFYIIFCVGLFFLLFLLSVQPNILSLVMLFVYFFYSFFFIFTIIHFSYGISISNLPIIFTFIIMFVIVMLTCFVLLGELCYVYKCLSLFVILNLFSLYFIFYYFKYYQNTSVIKPQTVDISNNMFYDMSNNTHEYYLYYNIFDIFYDSSSNPYVNTKKPPPNTNVPITYAPPKTIGNYISYYKLYVFIMCIFYCVIYLREYIREHNLPSVIQVFVLMIVFEMIVGLMMYLLNITKSSSSLQTFLWMELIPVYVTFMIAIISTILVMVQSSNSSIPAFIQNQSTTMIFLILLFVNIISACMSIFVYYYDTTKRLISYNTFFLWFFVSLCTVVISLLAVNRYYFLALLFVLFLVAIIGAILYFLDILSFTTLNIYYVIFFLVCIILGVTGFMYKNKINPDMIYGKNIQKISFNMVFKVILVLIILFTLYSFSNISSGTIEKFFIILIVCLLPMILFYMFYTSSKKENNKSVLSAIIQIIQETISIFSVYFYKFIIIIAVLIIAGVCMYNLITNQISSVVIYFLSFFFFLILYICYYFQDFIKGKYESAKFIHKVTLMNLLVYFAGIFIYYLIYAIHWLIKKKSSSSTTSTSPTSTTKTSSSLILLYLMLFVFLAFIFLYYRNHLSSSTSPYLNLLINIILYIPCLFVMLIEYISNQFNEKHSTYFIIIVIEIVLVLLYIGSIFLRAIYIDKNGTTMIREPVDLNIKTMLKIPPGYESNPSKPFALSFWFFVNSERMTTNKYLNIINFQNKPQVLYNAKLDSLIVDVSNNTWSNDVNSSNVPNYSIHEKGTSIDSSNNILLKKAKTNLIYMNKDIILQKWNYLVVNYNGSTMDIFINGKLVKSANQIVPDISSMTFYVGEDNGINGGFCNFIFFNNYLSYQYIINIYDSLKSSNPPLENVYWDKKKQKIEFSKINKLKEEYKKNNF